MRAPDGVGAAEPAPRGGDRPVRTCVGCRVRAADTELLRVVLAAGEAIPDPRRRMPGRGAWLHPDERCLAKAEKRRAFPRALRSAGAVGVEALRAELARRGGLGGGIGAGEPRPVEGNRKQVDPS
ncbi:YlxR family protein [Actinokineospora spheciospongiae]|nr:YlxR family protein [Actinokineospora spheciospongiae]PWW62448.1 hypothetical protein DFQ13_105262 [Actinokineospora spheciospongiae]